MKPLSITLVLVSSLAAAGLAGCQTTSEAGYGYSSSYADDDWDQGWDDTPTASVRVAPAPRYAAPAPYYAPAPRWAPSPPPRFAAPPPRMFAPPPHFAAAPPAPPPRMAPPPPPPPSAAGGPPPPHHHGPGRPPWIPFDRPPHHR